VVSDEQVNDVWRRVARLDRDQKAIARLVREHRYDQEDRTCRCISSTAQSKSDMPHMSIVTHSEHVAAKILDLAYGQHQRALRGRCG